MAVSQDIALMAHLMRRAGFGARREELEKYVAQGYEATVEWLLNPQDDDGVEEDIVDRYYIDIDDRRNSDPTNAWWLYRMINTTNPLEEKMSLFWHGLFATAYEKLQNGRAMASQIDLFHQHCLGNFRTMLLKLSRDPAMIIWLDNDTNHKGTPNENYGRELLELFSMGVGNYTEDDVKECARAFSGWTIANFNARYPWGPYPIDFEYRPDDHDDDEKTFLGEQGRFNGEDIIDIIVRQPATGRFVAEKLYNFFVSDDPAPADAIETLSSAYFESNYDIRSVMRVLLNSHFFKNAVYAKVKSPAEVVASVLRLVGDFQEPKPGLLETTYEAKYMGQELLNPPTVEGWHTGREWIDSGSLVGRVNFSADQVGDLSQPGVRDIVDRLGAQKTSMTPEELVDGCLDLIGPLVVEEKTRTSLVGKASTAGVLSLDTEVGKQEFAQRVAEMLQLIVATREFQFA
ncbi:MAG: DUF1800 domain-containing protein [Chloroflexi bacterium]|nr:DUF1800 domain-containing protein [Chloroflexota bacterium]MDA1218425.1 DUF1800 domain-containing protein [Chloroflexota bacterium]PKB57430.1 MAG: hypothetical protein BZY73_03265 [SAR202 cluster bacterium Casp-Chloro-G3]